MDKNVVVPWLLISAGTASLAYTAWSVWSALISRSWPTAAGRIISSRVDVSSSMRTTTYQAEISYEYEVGGRKYQAHRVHFGDGLASTWAGLWARREVNDHPAGSAVSVRYDPQRPARATIETGLHWYFLFDALFSCLFLVIPIAILRQQP